MRRLLWALLACLGLPAVASAQITATFLQVADDPADTTTYTFTAQNLGTAVSDRYITVVTTGRKSGTTSCTTPGVTVGGVTASYITHNARAISNCNVASIHKAAVPTGATGDIVVTWGTMFLQTNIAVYRSTGGQTTVAYATDTSLLADPSGTITIPATGYAVGGSITNNAGSTATWTGLTETYDVVMVSGGTTMVTGGLLNPGTLQSGLTCTVDWTTSGTETVGVFASWAPVASGTTPPTNLTLGVGAP